MLDEKRSKIASLIRFTSELDIGDGRLKIKNVDAWKRKCSLYFVWFNEISKNLYNL